MMDANYHNWTLDDLLLEIAQRKLAAGTINASTFPDADERRRRLARLLEQDDMLLRRYPLVSKYPEHGVRG